MTYSTFDTRRRNISRYSVERPQHCFAFTTGIELPALGLEQWLASRRPGATSLPRELLCATILC